MRTPPRPRQQPPVQASPAAARSRSTKITACRCLRGRRWASSRCVRVCICLYVSVCLFVCLVFVCACACIFVWMLYVSICMCPYCARVCRHHSGLSARRHRRRRHVNYIQSIHINCLSRLCPQAQARAPYKLYTSYTHELSIAPVSAGTGAGAINAVLLYT